MNVTPYLVPELAGELVLVEEGAVWTDEAGALRSVPTVVTDPVGLRGGLGLRVTQGSGS